MAIEGGRRGQWRWPVGLALYAVVSLMAIVYAPEWLVNSSIGDRSVSDALDPADRAAALTAARQTVLLSAGGLLAVFTLFLTQRRDALARERHEIDRDKLEIDRNKHEIDLDANRTTRYTEAIKQLGDEDHQAIRLGGIYALERIAIDSERDRQTILDVLTTWIRDGAPRADEDDEDHRPLRPSDLTAAIVVVGRISRLARVGEPINLVKANLESAVLTGAELSEARLMRADLSYARLDEASLAGAFLSRTSLHYARLRRINARGAFFTRTDFTFADLMYADLSKAKFAEANMSHARLHGAIFDGADLYAARGLTQMQAMKSFWTSTTRWPEGLELPSERRPPRSTSAHSNGNLSTEHFPNK